MSGPNSPVISNKVLRAFPNVSDGAKPARVVSNRGWKINGLEAPVMMQIAGERKDIGSVDIYSELVYGEHSQD